MNDPASCAPTGSAQGVVSPGSAPEVFPQIAAFAFAFAILGLFASLLPPRQQAAPPVVEALHARSSAPGAFFHGGVELGPGAIVAADVSIRGLSGTPVHLGEQARVGRGASVLSGFDGIGPTGADRSSIQVGDRAFAIYVGARATVDREAQLRGPARIGENAFVGAQALIIAAEIGDNCIVGPRAVVVGVRVPTGRRVPADVIVRTQPDADRLPAIDPSYPHARIGDAGFPIHISPSESHAEGVQVACP